MRRLSRRDLAAGLAGGLLAGRAGCILAQGMDAPAVVVGSLSFTESVILGEMLSLLLEDAGYAVERRFELGVSADAHAALVDGEIDVYVEYTGGGLVAILGLPVPTVAVAAAGTPAPSVRERTYATVADQYLERFRLVWLDEIGFNNSYALAVTRDTAAELELATIGELTDYAEDLTLGTDLEFVDRQDGLPALEATYGLRFGAVRPGEPALMYTAIASGEVDVITAYTTDGRLPGLDLVLLEDDRHAFPPYYAAPVVRQELLEERPELQAVLNGLAGTIDDATMARINREVDVDGGDPREVARGFLVERDLIALRDG